MKAREVLNILEDNFRAGPDAVCAALGVLADLNRKGFVILPLEPTEGMIRDGGAAILEDRSWHVPDMAKAAYRAMISAYREG